jgi:hypothetical protein
MQGIIINMPENVPSLVQPSFLIEVEIKYADDLDRLEFVIVSDEQADFQAGFLGESTVLAKTILGEPIGLEFPYFAGDARSVRILSIKKTDLSPDRDIASRRDETIRRAVQQSDQTNAMIFASSFSGKWGDYDPQAVEGWDNADIVPPKSVR